MPSMGQQWTTSTSRLNLNAVLADWTNPTEVDARSANGVLADLATPTLVDARSTNGVLA